MLQVRKLIVLARAPLSNIPYLRGRFLPPPAEVKKMARNTTTSQAFDTIMKGIKLFPDMTGMVYAKAFVHNATVFMDLNGEQFENYLNAELYNATSEFPAPTVVKSAISIANHRGKENPPEEVFLRFGVLNDVHMLDLRNSVGMVVEVAPTGWSLTTAPRVNFLRPHGGLEIPVPSSSGDYLKILNYLNLDEDGKLLTLPSMPALMMVNLERPIIQLIGKEGSGKSSVAKRYRKLMDPACPEVNDAKAEKRELALLLNDNAMPVLDNLTALPKFVSDFYCAAFSGGGIQFRTHYTNAGVYRMSYKRGLVITALDLPTMAPDFLDRSIIVDMNRVKVFESGSGTALDGMFELDRPNILGGMLDILVEAKKILPSIKVNNLPRFTDFARYGAAIAEILGYGAQRYVDAIRASKQAPSQQALVNSDPVAAAFMELAKGRSFSGDSNQLLAALGTFKPRNISGRVKWPENSVQLGKAVSRVVEELSEQGVFLEVKTTRKGKHYSVDYVPPAPFAEDVESDECVEGDANESQYIWVVDPVTGEVTPPPAPMPTDYPLSSDDVPLAPFGPESCPREMVFLDAPFIEVATNAPVDKDGFPVAPYAAASTRERPATGDYLEGYEQVQPDYSQQFRPINDGQNPLISDKVEPPNAPSAENGGVMCASCAYYSSSRHTCYDKGDNLPISTPFAFRHCDKYITRETLDKEEAEEKLAKAEQKMKALEVEVAEYKECLRRAEMTDEEKKEEDAEAVRNGACPDW